MEQASTVQIQGHYYTEDLWQSSAKLYSNDTNKIGHPQCLVAAFVESRKLGTIRLNLELSMRHKSANLMEEFFRMTGSATPVVIN